MPTSKKKEQFLRYIAAPMYSDNAEVFVTKEAAEDFMANWIAENGNEDIRIFFGKELRFDHVTKVTIEE